MESIDLIARENEFKKLNKQLEKKTESLMKEIEEVMQKPDMFSIPNVKLNMYNKTPVRKHRCDNNSPLSEDCVKTNTSSNTKPKDLLKKDYTNIKKNASNLKDGNDEMQHNNIILNKEHTSNSSYNIDSNCCQNRDTISNVTSTEKVVCNCCMKEKVSDEMEFLYAFVSINVKNNVFPQSYLKGKITVESVCKCLLAKLKLTQEQLDKLQSTMEKKNKQCEGHLTQVAELESERLTLLNTANTMKSETADMKAKYLAIQNRLNEKERLYKEQRSATDRLTTEIKQYKCKNISLESRVASQEEVIASLKQQLETAKLSEKEYRNSTRSLSTSYETTIKRLEGQVAALRTRLAQHRSLVDNLRAQRTLLSAERAVQSLNSQYCQLLENYE